MEHGEFLSGLQAQDARIGKSHQVTRRAISDITRITVALPLEPIGKFWNGPFC